MKKHTFIRNQLVAVIAAASFSNIALAGWTIDGNKILDPNGNPFVYRGINLAEEPTTDNMATLFRDVAATGANAIRIPVYSSAPSVETLNKYIQLCRENKLVCVLTNMGSTGYGDLTNSSSFVSTSLSWLDSRIKPLLNENADFVIINLANEPAGNDFPSSLYLADMKQTIALIRQLGLKNQIMIEAGGWGQDWQFIMRDNAEQLMAADPLKNLVFSVHMYEAYNDPVAIRNYLTSFTGKNLPIVVGEFAPKRKERLGEWKNPFGDSVEVAEESIMEIAQELGVGYLGWAWAGNRNGFTDLDMVVNWNPLQLTPWGDFFINSVNGVKATSKLATHYSNSNVPPIANFTVSASSGCMEGKLLLSAQGSYDPDGDQLTYEWSNGAKEYSTELTVASGTSVSATLKVTDATGMSASLTRNLGLWFFDSCSSSPSSRSSSSVPVKSSSSIADYSSFSSSSISRSAISSSRSSVSSFRSSVSSSSSSIASASSTGTANAKCSYVYNSQWNNGFTAAIRIQNISTKPIVNWSVNWEYVDGSLVTNLWNASLSGNNPYTASNLSWNSTIQPGQTVEFGFQGNKSAGAAVVPIVRGAVCQ